MSTAKDKLLEEIDKDIEKDIEDELEKYIEQQLDEDEDALERHIAELENGPTDDEIEDMEIERQIELFEEPDED